MTGKSGSILSGGLAEDFFEDAVEMGQRLKTDLKGDFADAQVGVEQEVFRLLDPHPGQVVRIVDPGGPLEEFAEIKSAGVHGLGHLPQG